MAFLNGKKFSRGTIDTGATFAQLAARAVSANEQSLDALHAVPPSSDITAPLDDNYIYCLTFSLPHIPNISRFDLQFTSGVDEYVAWQVGFTLTNGTSVASHTATVSKTSSSTTSSITVSSTGSTATNIKSWDFTIYMLEKSGAQNVRFKLGYRTIKSGTATDTAPVFFTPSFDPKPIGVPLYDYSEQALAESGVVYLHTYYNELIKNVIAIHGRNPGTGQTFAPNMVILGPSATGGALRGLILTQGDLIKGGSAGPVVFEKGATDQALYSTGTDLEWRTNVVQTITPLYALYLQAASPAPVIF